MAKGEKLAEDMATLQQSQERAASERRELESRFEAAEKHRQKLVSGGRVRVMRDDTREGWGLKTRDSRLLRNYRFEKCAGIAR